VRLGVNVERHFFPLGYRKIFTLYIMRITYVIETILTGQLPVEDFSAKFGRDSLRNQ
jgi:hypothetical protein